VAHDWEVVFCITFFKFVVFLQTKTRRGGRDKLCWAPSKKGMFNVKSFYNVLIPHDNDPFPYKSIWQNKVPSRVTFFIWSAALEKILPLDNLRKWYFIVVDWYCMCKKNEKLWSSIFALYGLKWVIPR
jgi:hypothetical protein